MNMSDYTTLIEYVNQFITPCVITTFDVDKPLILASNKAHEKLTGYSTEEILLKTPREAFQPIDSLGNDIRQSLRLISSWGGCIKNRNKNGKVVNYQIEITPVFVHKRKYFIAFKRPATGQRLSVNDRVRQIVNSLVGCVKSIL